MALPLAGQRIKAADFAAIFPVGVDAWTGYTPTLTQGATPTKTIEYAAYTRVGRKVSVVVSFAITAGTPGTAANAVLFSLPTGMDAVNYRLSEGGGAVFDSSAGLWYTGQILRSGVGIVGIQANAVSGMLGASSFTAALATGDVVTAAFSFLNAS